MGAEKAFTVPRWVIGIISFAIWVAIGRGIIFGGDATDASAGQQLTMILWTIGVVIADVIIIRAIEK